MTEQIEIESEEYTEAELVGVLIEALTQEGIEPIPEFYDMDTLPVVIAAKKLSDYHLFEDKGGPSGVAAVLGTIMLVYPEQEDGNGDSLAIIDHVRNYLMRECNEMYGKRASRKLERVLSSMFY